MLPLHARGLSTGALPPFPLSGAAAAQRPSAISLQWLLQWTRRVQSSEPAAVRALVADSRLFLHSEMSRRLASRCAALRALPVTMQSLPAIRQFDGTLRDLYGQHFAGAPLVPLPKPRSISDADLHAFDTIAETTRERLFTALSAVTHGLREWTLSHDPFRAPAAASSAAEPLSAVRQFLSETTEWSLAARTLLTHHSWAHAQWADPLGGGGSRPARARATVVSRMAVLPLLHSTLPQARALCVDKHGLAPDIRVDCHPTDLSLVAVESHVHFVLMELTKNALRSVIDRYGVLRVDEAPPIVVRARQVPRTLPLVHSGAASTKVDTVELNVIDGGVGLGAAGDAASARRAAHAFDPFFTDYEEPIADAVGYGYSRRFGSALTGFGLGLPNARAYCRLMGGTLTLRRREDRADGGGGAVAVALLNAHGTHEF
jgi:hypothetical protein